VLTYAASALHCYGKAVCRPQRRQDRTVFERRIRVHYAETTADNGHEPPLNGVTRSVAGECSARDRELSPPTPQTNRSSRGRHRHPLVLMVENVQTGSLISRPCLGRRWHPRTVEEHEKDRHQWKGHRRTNSRAEPAMPASPKMLSTGPMTP